MISLDCVCLCVCFLFTCVVSFTEDPTEHVDLAPTETAILKQMIEKMKELQKSQVPAVFPLPDPRGNPLFHGGVWTPGWC